MQFCQEFILDVGNCLLLYVIFFIEWIRVSDSETANKVWDNFYRKETKSDLS